MITINFLTNKIVTVFIKTVFRIRMSRPDAYYVVNALSRLNACYIMEHWKYLLRVLIYLYHTREQHLTYHRAATEVSNEDLRNNNLLQ